MKRYIKAFFVLLVIMLGVNAAPANAEDIPVLIWENGQVQNVVMGQGNGNQNWNLYLKNSNGEKTKLTQSATNSSGFIVYSIILSKNFPIGGYIVEAANKNGDVKQVAGIQIIRGSTKVISRIPFELFFVLFGFSLFLYLLNQAKYSKKSIRIYSEKLSAMPTRFQQIPNRLRFWIEHDGKQSLLKTISIEELKFDIKFARVSFIFGIANLILISLLQFTSGNWLQSNPWLISILIVVGSVFFSYGLLISFLALTYLLLNIATAKSLGEILAILVISNMFILPSLYNQFLLKILDNIDISPKYKRLFVPAVSSIIASAAAYQMLLLFESLVINEITLNKEVISGLIFFVFFIKNLIKLNLAENSENFEIVRSIGPMWTIAVSFLVCSVIYLWTTNIFVTISAFISVFLILASNWIKFKRSVAFKLPDLGFNFGIFLIIAVFISLYYSSRILPLDVVNRSNLVVLLIFPLDLLLAIYIMLANSETKQEASV